MPNVRSWRICLHVPVADEILAELLVLRIGDVLIGYVAEQHGFARGRVHIRIEGHQIEQLLRVDEIVFVEQGGAEIRPELLEGTDDLLL